MNDLQTYAIAGIAACGLITLAVGLFALALSAIAAHQQRQLLRATRKLVLTRANECFTKRQ